jgi:hypothetical protein
MDIIKEIIEPGNQYKAQIIKRNNGLFNIEIFKWDEEWKCWSQTTRNVSLIDTEGHAISVALEELRNRSGKDIIL